MLRHSFALTLDLHPCSFSVSVFSPKDLREPDGTAKLTFQGQSESVRDVQFNPFFGNYFAACFDNGNIQVRETETPGRARTETERDSERQRQLGQREIETDRDRDDFESLSRFSGLSDLGLAEECEL